MAQPWVHDVVTEHAALTTTGGCVWDAARRLCSFLEEMASELGLYRPGLRVLELGSGLGWLGMTLARNLKAAELVVLTEQEEGGGLDWLRHNLALNTQLPGMEVVRAEACDWRRYASLPTHMFPGDQQQSAAVAQEATWAQAVEHRHLRVQQCALSHGDEGLGSRPSTLAPPQAVDWRGRRAIAAPQPHPEQCDDPTSDERSSRPGQGDASPLSDGLTSFGDVLLSQQWDFILGSDLVYNTVGTECLPKVMRKLAGPRTRILYCHTRHRFDAHDMEFFFQLTACGLEWREVHEPSVPTPPPSPKPLTELFPEMRIAVYDMRLAAAMAEPECAAGPVEELGSHPQALAA